MTLGPDERPAARLTPEEPSGPRGLGALNGLIGREPEGFFDALTDEELADRDLNLLS